MFSGMVAESAANNYLERLGQSALVNKVLIDPSKRGTPEEANAWLQVKGDALEQSGLKGLPPALLGSMADKLGALEGQIKGKLYGLQVREDATRKDATTSEWIGLSLRNYVPSVKELYDSNKPDDQVNKDFSILSADLLKGLQGKFKEQIDAGHYTAGEWLGVFWQGIDSTVQQLANDGRFQEAGFVIDLATEMANSQFPISGEGSANLWSLQLPGGGSIEGKLLERREGLRPLRERYEQEQLGQGLLVDLKTLANATADPAARAAASARARQFLLQAADNPELLKYGLSLIGGVEDFGQKPTEGQLQAQRALEIQLNDPLRDRASVNQSILNSGLTMTQQLSLLNRNTQNANPLEASIADARRLARDMGTTDQAVNEITARQNQAGLIQDDGDGKGVAAAAAANRRNLEIQVNDRVAQKVRALQESKQTVTPDMMQQLYRETEQEIKTKMLKEAGGVAQPTTNSQRVMSELNFVRQQVQSGKRGIEVFPPSVLEAARKNNIDTSDYRAVARYMVDRMGWVTDSKGQKVFADPNKAWRESLSRKPPQGQAAAGAAGGGMNPWQTFGEMLGAGMGGGGPTYSGQPPKPQAKPEAKPSSTGPQSNAGFQPTQIISTALGQIVGVLTPPAAAATLDAAPVRNQEYTSNMAAIWRGRGSLSIDTPPLPQVDGNAPVSGVPLKIASDKHPMFVAIGVAEGTRTPGGGYTNAYHGHRDPASGAWNKGTVSGQNAASASGVDRQWMAKLNGVTTRVAPLLQRIGLAPGTQGWNRLLFNVLDLTVQSPLAAQGFMQKLPQIVRAGVSIEAIAKARADSFFNPSTGRLEAGGFGNSYNRLLADQRSRSGVWDYKRRL
jgi:hypothetical protein